MLARHAHLGIMAVVEMLKSQIGSFALMLDLEMKALTALSTSTSETISRFCV